MLEERQRWWRACLENRRTCVWIPSAYITEHKQTEKPIRTPRIPVLRQEDLCDLGISATWGAISPAKPVCSRFSERTASDSKKMRWSDWGSQSKLTSGLHMQVHTHVHVPPAHVPLHTLVQIPHTQKWGSGGRTSTWINRIGIQKWTLYWESKDE